MGKGDKKTRRGKIFAGSFGKTRAKHKKQVFVASAVSAEEKPARKPRKPVITKAKAAEEAVG